MLYYMYQVTNNLNNKIYVGVHKTKNIDDGYMGSGKVIKRAINKYGIENFTKVILEHFDNAEAMYAKEKEVVTIEFLARDDVYNLRRGGFGGFDHINATGLNYKGFSSTAERSKVLYTAAKKEAMIAGRRRASQDSNKMQVQIHKLKATRLAKGIRSDSSPMNTLEANIKRKATFALNGHSQGEKNNSFGKKWITNEIETIRISKDDTLPIGWRYGRVLKMNCEEQRDGIDCIHVHPSCD